MSQFVWALMNPCGCPAALVATTTEHPERPWKVLYGAHESGAEKIKIQRGLGFSVLPVDKSREDSIRAELAKASVRAGMPGRYACRSSHELTSA